MEYKRIDGLTYEKMAVSGLNNLINYEKQINALNVFPVADGDTGTNMRLTLQSGISRAGSNKNLAEYLKPLSEGMLLGARGNSGVILSQIFKGFYGELQRCGIADAGEVRDALVKAYRSAYKAVVRPVEGTILTVSREGIENIRGQIYGNTTVDNVFSMYLAEMRKSLKNTPEMLPVLGEAGVVDSGALGYITIVEGMVRYLYGEGVEIKEKDFGSEIFKETAATNFNENSVFDCGYCLEFLLQRLNDKNYNRNFRLNDFKEDLAFCGNSLVVIEEGSVVKVHIHTLKPAKVIELAQKYGEFITFKLENMQIQNEQYKLEREKEREKLPEKPLSIICVADGNGVAELFKNLGADIILSGGQTMNTSTEEFLSAFEKVNAEKILVFPNNCNIIKSAEQARDMSGKDNIDVVATENLMQCYYALAMDIADSDDLSARIAAIKEGAESVHTVSVATAVKSYQGSKFSCEKGDKIAFVDGKIKYSAKDVVSAVKTALKEFSGVAAAIALKGKDFHDDVENDLTEAIYEVTDGIETEYLDGGQSVFEVIIGVIKE